MPRIATKPVVLHTLTTDEYRRQVWAAMTEDQWQRMVVGMARANGWLLYHTWNSRHSVPGFPDICAVHPRWGLIFLELKTEKGRVRPEQTEWIDAIRSAGVRAWIVRPSDEAMVADLLAGRREY